MELRRYWRIVVDRFPLIGVTFVVASVVAALSVFVLPQGASAYEAAISLAVRPQALGSQPCSQAAYGRTAPRRTEYEPGGRRSRCEGCKGRSV